MLYAEVALRLCETPPSPPNLDQVGIKICKQLFSQVLAFTNKKKLQILEA